MEYNEEGAVFLICKEHNHEPSSGHIRRKAWLNKFKADIEKNILAPKHTVSHNTREISFEAVEILGEVQSIYRPLRYRRSLIIPPYIFPTLKISHGLATNPFW